MTFNRISLVFATLATAALSQATNLSGFATADNAFTAYISTVSGVQGTQIGSGNNWGATFALTTTALTTGQDYYLQIAAQDFGAPDGFIGDFSLDSSDHSFANGGGNLLTDTVNWTVSNVSFASGMVTPTSYGANGVGPWGTRSNISANALWIWTANQGDRNVFFETKITAKAVPEPATMTGLAAVGLLLRRARRKA